MCSIIGNAIMGLSTIDHLGENTKQGPPLTVYAVCATLDSSVTTDGVATELFTKSLNEELSTEAQAAILSFLKF